MEKQTLALLSVSLTAVVLAAALTMVTLADGRQFQTLNTNGQNSQAESFISVMGSAQTTIVPDTVVLMFMVEERAPTPSEALARVSSAANNVVSTILRLGISSDDVKTTGLNIYPEYVYREREPPQIVGYIATYSIEVKTKKIVDAGALVESAVNAGADYITGIYFTASAEQLGKVYKQLLAAAVGDAESKLEAVLAPLGMKKIGVKSVSIMDSTPAVPHRAAAEATTAPPPILPGTTTYTLSVTITYVIAPR
ncbi:MAG: SIMPL domain-containing protein [Candidatus Caldarchaeum sp.]